MWMRQPCSCTRRELEPLVDLLGARGIRHVRFVSGGVAGLDGDGLTFLRIQVALAAKESADKSRRVKRKLLQNAEAGLPHGGYHRPFGYAADKITVVPAEAAVIRDLTVRFIAGESFHSLARSLDAAGTRTIDGGPWRTSTVRALLCSGRIAGVREHHGEAIGKACWAAIISDQERVRILARMAQLKRSGRRSPRRYLLSGLLKCGKCQNTLFSSSRAEGQDRRVRRYVCLSGPDHRGCGRLTIVAEPLEEWVSDVVLLRLDTQELADALADRVHKDQRLAQLSDQLADDSEQRNRLMAMFTDREITIDEWRTAREILEPRMRQAQAELSRAASSHGLDGAVGNGKQLLALWATLDLSRRHAIVGAVMDHAIIAPGIPGNRTMDVNRIEPVWRL